MCKVICALASIVFLLGCSHQQTRSKSDAPQVPIVTQPFFFFAQKADQSWFLLGTHHYISIEEIPSWVKTKFYASEVLVLESSGTPNVDHDIYKLQTRPPISESSQKALLARGVPERAILKFSPEILCKLYYWGPNRAGSESMDSTLEKEAHSLRKGIISLDEAKEIEMVTVDSFKGCDLNAMTLNSPEAVEEDVKSQLNQYRSGDPKFYSTESIYDETRKRNLLWIEKLKVLRDKKIFIAVGVSHLYGPTGLLKLLEENKFKIERIVE